MSLESLKQEVGYYQSLDNLIIAILFMTQKDLIKKDPALFHKAFQEMKQEVPMSLLNELIFDVSTPTPWSEELDQALFRLEASRLLPYTNEEYLMNETRLQQFNAYLRFSEAEKAKISECSKILGKYLS